MAPTSQAAASWSLPLSSRLPPVTSRSQQLSESSSSSGGKAPASSAWRAALGEPAVRLARAPAAQ